MSGRLLLWELRKLWTMPMLPIFLLLCLGFNTALLTGVSGSADYGRYVAAASDIIGTRMGREFAWQAARLPEDPRRARLLEETAGAEDIFESYDTGETLERFTVNFFVTGTPARRLERKYQCLQQAVGRLAEEDAAMDVLAAGATAEMMNVMLRRCAMTVQGEGMVLGSLLALYVWGIERVFGTQDAVYTTRIGRKIGTVKLLAACLSGLAGYALLAVGSTAVFALVWQPGPIWAESISGQFHRVALYGVSLPFLTWKNFTVAGYLTAHLLLGAGLVLLFVLLGAASELLTGSTIGGAALMLMGTAVNLEVLLFSGNGRLWGLYQAAHWTPLALWQTGRTWFSDAGIGGIVPWQECWCLAVWLAVSTGTVCLAFRRRERKDVL